MLRSIRIASILILLLTASIKGYTQPIPSIEEILLSKGVKPVEKVIVDGEYMFQMNVPTGQRMADIQEYLRYVMIDREGCYQDLSLAIGALGYGLKELKENNGKIDEITKDLDKVEKKSDDIAEELINEKRTPWLRAIWNTTKDIGKYVAVGFAGYYVGSQ